MTDPYFTALKQLMHPAPPQELLGTPVWHKKPDQQQAQQAKKAEGPLISVIGNTFYEKGQKISLDVLMMNLMLKRVKAVDGLLTRILEEMNENNKQTQMMNDFLTGLRDKRPTSSGGKIKPSDMYDILHKVDMKYNVDVIKMWGLEGVDKNLEHFDPTKPKLNLKEAQTLQRVRDLDPGWYTQSFIDQKIESIKAKISGVNSNQQMEQIKIEKYNNVRNEAMQMVSTIMKSVHDSIQSTVRNIA